MRRLILPVLVLLILSVPAVMIKIRHKKQEMVFPDQISRIYIHSTGMEQQENTSLTLKFCEERILMEASGFDEEGKSWQIHDRQMDEETVCELILILKQNGHSNQEELSVDRKRITVTLDGEEGSVSFDLKPETAGQVSVLLKPFLE